MGRSNGRRIRVGDDQALTPEEFLVPLRQGFGEVPEGEELVGGRVLEGAYGKRLRRERGDYVELNSLRARVRYRVSEELNVLQYRLTGLAGGEREALLDEAFVFFSDRVLEAREQFDIYGANSQQGRVLDQVIRSSVYARQMVEGWQDEV